VAWRPSIPGVRMSMSTTSGILLTAAATASAPSLASSMTSMPVLVARDGPETGPHQGVVVDDKHRYGSHRPAG
jgi:hypothetical protein